MKWYVRYRETVIPLLAVTAAALLLANLVKHGVLTSSSLKANKDALAALQSAVQVIVITLGAIFSYYRFFRGRTFVSRADADVQVQVLNAGPKANLHTIKIELKNLGTVSIFDPRPVVHVRYFGDSPPEDEVWDHWTEAALSTGRGETYAVVDSGETASFSAYHEVKKALWAVEYAVFITDADGVTWKRSTVAANTAQKSS